MSAHSFRDQSSHGAWLWRFILLSFGFTFGIGPIAGRAGGITQDPPATTTSTTLVSELIIGRWTGSVTVPEGWQPIEDFWVEFRSDGSYSAGSTGAPAFYYGTNTDYPEKVYSVNGHYPDGQPGSGTIAIVWDSDGTVITVQQGSLENIVFSEAGDRLEFDFWRTWAGVYGPVHYDLARSDPTTSTTTTAAASTTTIAAASTTVAPTVAPPTNVGSTLPSTGSESADMQLLVAITLLVLGGIAVRTTRTRRS